jgi:hypothetical protein
MPDRRASALLGCREPPTATGVRRTSRRVWDLSKPEIVAADPSAKAHAIRADA